MEFNLVEALQQQQSLQDHLGTGEDWLRVFNAATEAGHEVEKANELATEFVLT